MNIIIVTFYTVLKATLKLPKFWQNDSGVFERKVLTFVGRLLQHTLSWKVVKFFELNTGFGYHRAFIDILKVQEKQI